MHSRFAGSGVLVASDGTLQVPCTLPLAQLLANQPGGANSVYTTALVESRGGTRCVVDRDRHLLRLARCVEVGGWGEVCVCALCVLLLCGEDRGRGGLQACLRAHVSAAARPAAPLWLAPSVPPHTTHHKNLSWHCWARSGIEDLHAQDGSSYRAVLEWQAQQVRRGGLGPLHAGMSLLRVPSPSISLHLYVISSM